MWRRIRALAAKEFLTLLKDRRSRIVVFVPPILQVLVFGYAATFDLDRIPFALRNEDGGLASRDLVARFTGSHHFRLAAVLESDREIAPRVDGKDVLMVLRIGRQFSRELLAGRSGPVGVIVDGRNSNTAAIVLNYVNAIIEGFDEDWSRRTGGTSAPAYLETRAWFNENLLSRWFIVAGIVGLLTLVVTTIVTALSVAREREQGTFDQLLVTPFRPVEILAGKALPGILIGIVESSAIVLIATLWFEVPLRGSLGTLYAGLLLFLFSTVGVGLMISSLAVTQQQGLLGGFLFIVPSILLSGFATPIANMPEWVQWITLLNPMRYFLVIVRGVFLQGSPFDALIGQFWPLAVLGAVSLALAGALFRRRLY